MQINKAKKMFNDAIKKHKYDGKYVYCYCTKSSHFSFIVEETLRHGANLETSFAYDIDLIKQLYKLINVVKISELDPRDSVERELMLVTLRADITSRSPIIELVNLFEGRVVDVGHDELTVSLDGTPDRLDDVEELLRPFGIVELQRTGRVALPKLEHTAPNLRSVRRTA